MILLRLALLLAAADSLGAALLRRRARWFDGWAWRTLFRLSLGLGALAYAVLALGLVGLARPAAAWLLVLAALAAGLPTLMAEARAARRQTAKQADTPVEFVRETLRPHLLPGGAWPPWATLLAGLVLTLLAGGAVLTALAPAVAYDDLTYHLAAPKVYARTGQVAILPYDHHTAFPFTLEMLYTLALLLGDDRLARLIQVVFWLLCLLAVWLLGAEYLGRRTGWLATLVLATTPLTLALTGSGYTEFGFALYQLLALLALLEYLNLRATAVGGGAGEPVARPRQPGWLPLVGLLAGFCYGTKYTGALVVVFVVAAILVCGRRDGLSRRALRVDATVVLLTAGLTAGPWVARTWLATGNPVFPFAHGVFRSPLWSADRAEVYDRSQKEFGRAFAYRDGGLVELEPTPTSHRSLARLLSAPWHLTFDADWFADRGHGGPRVTFGPGWLAFGLPGLLGWLLLRRRRRPPVYEEIREETVELVYRREFGREVPVPTPRRILERTTIDTARVLGLVLAHGLLWGVVWFATMQYSRYLAPHLAVWAVLVGWAADGLLRLRLSAGAAGVALVVHLTGGLAFGLWQSYAPLQVARGRLTRADYAAAALPAWRAMDQLNRHAPPEAKVILYGEPRGYWLDRDYLWGERGHHTLIPDSARTSTDRYIDFLRDELGVTHALIFEAIFPTNRTVGHDDLALVTRAIAAGRLTLWYADPSRPVKVYAVR